eukprot:jgi/Mesvir1/12185/Mv00423-RA.4
MHRPYTPLVFVCFETSRPAISSFFAPADAAARSFPHGQGPRHHGHGHFAADDNAAAWPPVHPTITCDGCGMSPIMGARYKCLDIYNFDLCQDCKADPGVPESARRFARFDSPRMPGFQFQGPLPTGQGGFVPPPPSPLAPQFPPPPPFMRPPPGMPPFCGAPGSQGLLPRGCGFGGPWRRGGMGGRGGPPFGAGGHCPWTPTGGQKVGGSAGPRTPCHRPVTRPSEGGAATAPSHSGGSAALDARFVADVSIEDGSTMAPGSRFVKIWRLRNSGSSPWPPTTVIVQVGGDDLGADAITPLALPAIPVAGDAAAQMQTQTQMQQMMQQQQQQMAGQQMQQQQHSPYWGAGGMHLGAGQQPLVGLLPGEEVDVAVDMQAPENTGRHVAYFRLAEGRDGRRFGQRVWCMIQVTGGVGSHAGGQTHDQQQREVMDAEVATTGKVENAGMGKEGAVATRSVGAVPSGVPAQGVDAVMEDGPEHAAPVVASAPVGSSSLYPVPPAASSTLNVGATPMDMDIGTLNEVPSKGTATAATVTATAAKPAAAPSAPTGGAAPKTAAAGSASSFPPPPRASPAFPPPPSTGAAQPSLVPPGLDALPQLIESLAPLAPALLPMLPGLVNSFMSSAATAGMSVPSPFNVGSFGMGAPPATPQQAAPWPSAPPQQHDKGKQPAYPQPPQQPQPPAAPAPAANPWGELMDNFLPQLVSTLSSSVAGESILSAVNAGFAEAMAMAEGAGGSAPPHPAGTAAPNPGAGGSQAHPD